MQSLVKIIRLSPPRWTIRHREEQQSKNKMPATIGYISFLAKFTSTWVLSSSILMPTLNMCLSNAIIFVDICFVRSRNLRCTPTHHCLPRFSDFVTKPTTTTTSTNKLNVNAILCWMCFSPLCVIVSGAPEMGDSHSLSTATQTSVILVQHQ